MLKKEAMEIEFLKTSNNVKNWYISKVGDRSWGRPEGSLFNSYYTDV